MSQEELILLAFKIVILGDIAAILAFIGIYTVIASWWKNALGRTIVIKDILLVLALTPSALSFFFHFSRLTSHIAAWCDIGLFSLIAVAMVWRSAVWVKIHRKRVVKDELEGKET